MLDSYWLNPRQKTIDLDMENILPESRTEGTDVKWGIWRFEKLFLCKLAGNTVLFFCRVLYIVKTHGFMSEIIVF